MKTNQTSNWNLMRDFLGRYMQEGVSYRVGTIHQAYIKESGGADISNKDFAMFLRDQVMKDDGMLKRVAHGTYEIRTEQNDRGILFTRKAEMPTAEKTAISLDEVLDESLELTSKIEAVFEVLNRQNTFLPTAQAELRSIQTSLLQSLDTAVTGITAIMAWCDDNMDEDVR